MSKKPTTTKAAKKKVAKKRATKKSAKKKAATGRRPAKTAKRYADEFKRQVLDFVESVGRGGAAQAAKKFGVSPLSISNWKKKLGLRGSTSSRKPAMKAKSSPASRDQVLAKMTKLSAKLAASEKEQAAMQKEFDQLKGQL